MSLSDVKGSGMANTCPVLATGTSDVKGALKPGTYKFDKVRKLIFARTFSY